MIARSGVAGMLLCLAFMAMDAGRASAQGPVILPPQGPVPLDPYGVADLFGYLPDRWIARQPVGHQIVPTGPNGYIYAPVYAEDALGESSIHEGDLPLNEAGEFAYAAADQAVAAFRQGDDVAAMAALRMALAAQPADAGLVALASEIMFAQGAFAPAAELIARALPDLPDDRWGDFTRLNCDRDTAAYTDRLRELEQWVRVEPDRIDARLLLAWHYKAMGHPASALRQLQRIVRADPENPAASILLQRLSPPRPARPHDAGPREF